MLKNLRNRAGYARSIRNASSGGAVEKLEAIRSILSSSHPASEETFKAIEQRRKQLQRDETSVEFVDHGAGSGRATTSMTVSHLAKASKNKFWGQLLYRICAAVNADTSLELGSCVGLSGSYIAAGSKSLVTVEGDRTLSRIAQDTFDGLGLNARCVQGAFREVLEGVLAPMDAISFAFIDGHHDGDATLEYLKMIKPKLQDGAIVVFDDIKWSPSMEEAWDDIRADSKAWLDIRQLGIATF